MTRLTRALLTVAALAPLTGCEDRSPRASAPPPPVASAASKSATAPTPPPSAAPRSLLELPTTPYLATLTLDGTRPVLLTASALYYLDEQPPRPVPFETGDLGVVLAGDVVRWMEGELRRRPHDGGSWLPLAHPAAPPQRLAAWKEQLAWVQPEAGGASVWSARGAEPRRLVSASAIAALAIRDDQLFFVEELSPTRWRLGAVAASGGAARYAEPQTGRAPAMLAVTSDVFYYDGPSLSVHRVSTDLRRSERVGSDVVCSPLAVAESVYCSQPGGIVALALSAGAAPRVVVSTRGTVTAMLATRTELLWLRESSKNGLAVEAISL